MKKYKNFLFDLDGTLYAIEWDIYKDAYFEDDAEIAYKLYGVDKTLAHKVFDYAHNYIIQDVKKPNYSKQQVAFEYIARQLNLTFEQVAKISDMSQSDNIKKVQDRCVTLLHDVIDACIYLQQAGYRLILATNSYFPRRRILERLAWTGIPSDTFEFINDWTQTDSVKPDTKFFKDIVEKFNLNKAATIMIGNDKAQDSGCMNCGIDFYLVTDNLENGNADVTPTFQGNQRDFGKFIKDNF